MCKTDNKLMYTVNYLGKTYTSQSGFKILDDIEYGNIVRQWYNKPNYRDVQIEMNNIRKGGITVGNIVKYYFRDIMDNTVKYFDKWSINEVINNKELLSIFVDKINKNPKVFCSNSIIDNIDTAFRLGGKGIASKVSNFPVGIVDDILYKYNVNNNWYDFSCGWGARLTGALKNKVNYFGTDPNYLLCDRLNQYANDYKSTNKTNSIVKIWCQGSEKFIPELKNTIGLAFSSPPYFLLEDYKIGEQSYKSGTSYECWKQNYYKPTIKNIFEYLTDDGYLIINIKDFDKYSLEQDTINIAQECGFELYKVEKLSQVARASGSISGTGNTAVDVDENIYVFCKNGKTPKICYNQQLSLFE